MASERPSGNASPQLPSSPADRQPEATSGSQSAAAAATASTSRGAQHERSAAKRRHRSPEKQAAGCSSSDDGENDAAGRKHPPKRGPKPPPSPKAPRREPRSGYSSSEESGAEEQQPAAEEAVEQPQLRQRAAAGRPAPAPDEAGWEMVERCAAKESDVSWTGNESSDDFWKGAPEGAAARPKPRKPKRREAESSLRFWRRAEDEGAAVGRRLLAAGAEWRAFKAQHAEEVARIRRRRNECAVQLLLVFIFCGVGGIVFHSVEGAFEMPYKCGVKRVKRDFVDTLWSKSHYMREDEWKSMARGKLMEFENQLYDAYEAGMTTYSGQRAWSFLNSFVYCVTVVTTIGYGHIAPTTTVGRMITIIYSLFGIPLFLILLADYGKLFTRMIKFFWAYVRRLYYTGSCRKVRKTVPVQEVVKGAQLVFDMTKIRKTSASKAPDPNLTCPTSPSETPALSTYTIDDEFNLPISVAVSILLLYMLSGAALFMKLEKWAFFESFYFVYISVSTIGFGDLVLSNEIHVLLLSLVYFVFGLSLTSMCINVITEKLTDSFRQATAKIGATMGMEVSEGPANGTVMEEVN